MNIYRFIDESFESNNAAKYRLSIRCSPGGFSFLVSDPVLKKHLCLSEYEFNSATPFQFCKEFRAVLPEEPILSLRFQDTRIGWHGSKEMLFPDDLIKDEQLSFTYQQAYEFSKDETLMNFKLPNRDATIVYSLPNLIREFFTELYPECRFLPMSATMFPTQTDPLPPIFIRIEKMNNDLAIAVFLNQRIDFLNHFYVKTSTDCLYYILYVAKQLVIEAEAHILLSGKLDAKSELIRSLKKRFREIKWAKYDQKYTVNYKFLANPEHFHYSLTQLALCE